MTHDLTIDLGEQMLNCRTAGIIVKDNHVLMHKNKKDPFWTLIGGRIQLGEDSAHAVKREFEEELGILAKAERLLWSVENLLRGTGEVISLESGEFHYEWVPLEKMEELPIKPDFLRGKLVNLPLAPMHLIHKETFVAETK